MSYSLVNTSFFIPLTIDLVNIHNSGFLTYLTHYINSSIYVDWDSSTVEAQSVVTNSTSSQIQSVTSTSLETIRNHRKHYGDDYRYTGKICLLPRETFDNLLQLSTTLRPHARNALIKTFCYLVCQCWQFQDFCRSQENIAKDLNINIKEVRRHIRWLIENKFIFCKHKAIHFEGRASQATQYQLYIDEVPPHYANGEWFVGHLAEREAASIDDILHAFGTKF